MGLCSIRYDRECVVPLCSVRCDRECSVPLCSVRCVTLCYLPPGVQGGPAPQLPPQLAARLRAPGPGLLGFGAISAAQLHGDPGRPGPPGIEVGQGAVLFLVATLKSQTHAVAKLDAPKVCRILRDVGINHREFSVFFSLQIVYTIFQTTFYFVGQPSLDEVGVLAGL